MQFLKLEHYGLNALFRKKRVFSFSNCQFVFRKWTFLGLKNVQIRKSFYRFGNFAQEYVIWVFILKENILY